MSADKPNSDNFSAEFELAPPASLQLQTGEAVFAEDREDFVIAEYDEDEASSNDSLGLSKSWLFRAARFCSKILYNLFGIASLVFLLAVLANIPLLQFLCFGYLLEVTGRVARGSKVRESFIGIRKASHIGGILLGTWLLIFPIRLLSMFWLDAYLIDPDSFQTAALRMSQWILIGLTVAHIVAAWLCGGKLRYFFWPVVAPFSIGVWLIRRSRITRKLLAITLGWISPNLVADICAARPVTDWFLPAILWRKITAGNLYSRCRDGVWDFFTDLKLPFYFWLGLKGFAGTFLWLVIPTLFLMGASILEGGTAVVSGLFGVGMAIPVFALLPYLQAHFSTDGKMRRFFEIRKVFQNFGRAPVAHVVALLMTLLFAIPLFLLKIEEIPAELLWTLSLVFILFTWPARIIAGWAYQRGAKRETAGRWWVRYPIIALAIPISFSFVIIFFGTRYISWNGALSLLENHVFLLPAPFWL